MKTVPSTTSGAADDEVRKDLERGERLLWSGAPRQGLRLRAGDAFLIPFSLLWGGFAFFWEYTALSSGKTPIFFQLWGVPFVLAGLYIIVGRFFLDNAQRRRTFYGVTDRRAIIVSGLTNRTVKSLMLRNLGELALTERSDGSGSIMFGSNLPGYAMWYGVNWPGMSQRLAPTFEMIDDARNVYRLIKDAQRARD